MSDQESDTNVNVLEDIVVTKFKMASEVANFVLLELVGLCKPGANVVQLCEFGDNLIDEKVAKVYKKEKEMKKGIAFATCISMNNIVSHFSPIASDQTEVIEIKDGDLIKIDLGVHVDGYAAIVGHTFVVGASLDNKVVGRKADVIMAAHVVAEAILRFLRPGADCSKVGELVSKAAAEFDCRLIEGIHCHQMKKLVYDAEKIFILNPMNDQKDTIDKCKFESNDVWDIDILVSTGIGKSKEYETRTTVFKKNETFYPLKLAASRQLCSGITQKFLEYPFNIRAFSLNKARLGMQECVKNNLMQPLTVFAERPDEFVAQFRFTVLLMPNGPMRITGLPFDASLYKSEYKVKDASVKEVLSQPIKIQKKKPAKTA